MKLTEAKLKQLIRESMGQSKYYTKLMALMSTEEGFLQAQSLFEMVEDMLPPEEQSELRLFFSPLEIAREIPPLVANYKKTYDNYKLLEDEMLSGIDVEEQIDKALEEMDEAESAYSEKQDDLIKKLITIKENPSSSEIFLVVKNLAKKITGDKTKRFFDEKIGFFENKKPI